MNQLVSSTLHWQDTGLWLDLRADLHGPGTLLPARHNSAPAALTTSPLHTCTPVFVVDWYDISAVVAVRCTTNSCCAAHISRQQQSAQTLNCAAGETALVTIAFTAASTRHTLPPAQHDGNFRLKIRVPGWSVVSGDAPVLRINGEASDCEAGHSAALAEARYCTISRQWAPGEGFTILLFMSHSVGNPCLPRHELSTFLQPLV